VEINGIGNVVIADTNHGVPFKVKHYRSTGINFRLVLGKRKTSADLIIGLLVVTIRYRIPPGLIKEFSPVGSI
jgi:hypothetical protein